jgi:hypothetical protein
LIKREALAVPTVADADHPVLARIKARRVT